MRRGIISVVVLALLASLSLYRSSSLQDWLMARLSKAVMSQHWEEEQALQALVCGSASPLGVDPGRAQACIAIVTPEHLFIFDTGAGSVQRLMQSRLPLDRINGVFFTHYHSDHIAALGDLNLNSWVNGRPAPLQVYGPAGINTVVAGFNMAYQLDRGYRTAHHGEDFLPSAAGLLQAHEIDMGIVWSDAKLVIRAIKVDHSPISPAMAYRIDYAGRSIVISGDTVVTEDLFTAAQDVDLLFHDALSREVLNVMIDAAAHVGRERIAQIMSDVIDYHADASQLEARSAAANIQQLVFYHMVPTPANPLLSIMFKRDLNGKTILAEDNMVFTLPVGSREIIQR